MKKSKKSKKNKFMEEMAATVIGKGIRIDGKLLSGQGIVRIEGEYYGDINIDGELILEKSGQIFGNISVNIAHVSGSITGDVICSDILHIKTTGRIKGDIACEAILMDEGAVFIGYCNMNERIPESDPLGILED
jgi:cytoskeletal protein CcmA (bactofilin family)